MQTKVIEATTISQPAEQNASLATFYTHVLCPYAQRAWLALLEKVRLPLICSLSLVSLLLSARNRVLYLSKHIVGFDRVA
jgi:hypothetical protein